MFSFRNFAREIGARLAKVSPFAYALPYTAGYWHSLTFDSIYV